MSSSTWILKIRSQQPNGLKTIPFRKKGVGSSRASKSLESRGKQFLLFDCQASLE